MLQDHSWLIVNLVYILACVACSNISQLFLATDILATDILATDILATDAVVIGYLHYRLGMSSKHDRYYDCVIQIIYAGGAMLARCVQLSALMAIISKMPREQNPRHKAVWTRHSA